MRDPRSCDVGHKV